MSNISNLSAKFNSITSSSLQKMDSAIAQPNQSMEFGNRIENALENVAEAQKNSNELSKAYELGIENDLSKVMVSQQISSLGFQFTLNARNKVLSAYKDIMNMPV